jgi:hypothetical protein
VSTFLDAFGATVTGSPETGWTRGGATIGACSQAQAMSVFDGMAPSGWVPPAPPPPTTIDALSFMRRFTPAELSALVAANPIWGFMVAAAGTITVTDPVLVTDMQEAVAAGALTQARMTQVLDLAVVSP